MRRKLELAQRYRSAKQPSKAIPLLQQAVTDPRIKVDAQVLLGECFIDEKKLDLARRQFERALEGISPQDSPAAYKSAHYLLGRIYEKAGKKDEAIQHYNDVLNVDYEYRDVLKRMQELEGADDAVSDGLAD
jgi:tetratricopeptide (TPR) repeat protein